MNKKLVEQLKIISKERQTKDDPCHDFNHILRVLNLGIKIGKKEKADLEVVIPAILFHDTVVYRKDLPESRNETNESADVAGNVLREIKKFPQEKIEQVQTCIRECSFSKGIVASTIEGKVVQDADRLESVGAISIMRTFTSGAQMNRLLYFPEDPLRENSKPPAYPQPLPASLDLFFTRLLLVGDSMRTETGKKMASRRAKFLDAFLKELRKELKESGIVK
ncbi:MAG: hypothetical protein A3J47_01130 [Candidatus Yanofskybacteria bacterium RIFCSPHIGHO2_02_FULL_43_22]|uniref:HD domain-containing protein n=1 Tax=Candidatus Yanofskybacteria bacterium RIFCSPHIGHO2_02_FULL_43_22 TaxID=1802681 RepID=A0A1F8FIZ2_9BACT|nr:MAG: hypothetical protein A3J47_01130 [Candidatus Yanofskybacteria bacterium RIFCSPHIGHO2_02_FULL_43_22]